MKISLGTKSLLFGAHQVVLHPLQVAYAWYQLFGFPWDPRLWCAFIVHDWGYFGKPNMDGHEGATHPRLGAEIMHWLFDRPRHRIIDSGGSAIVMLSNYRWYNFTILHSRRYAKGGSQGVSRLCIADKAALLVTPEWLYKLMVRMTGEWEEYALVSRVNIKWGQTRKDWCDTWYNHARYSIKNFIATWQEENDYDD